MLQGAIVSMPNQFSYTIHWQVNQILNSKLVNIAQSTNTVTTTFSQSLKNYIIRKHIFSSFLRWWMRNDSGRHEQQNCNDWTVSHQQALKILRKPLFQATLADLTSTVRVCQISQPYNNDGRQYDFTNCTATISFLQDPSMRIILLKAP